MPSLDYQSTGDDGIERVMWAQLRDVSTLKVTSFGWGLGTYKDTPPFQILLAFPKHYYHSINEYQAPLPSAHCLVFLQNASPTPAILPFHKNVFKVIGLSY